jgi:hypothetical protein
MSKPGAERLQSMLAWNHAIAEHVAEADFPLQPFEHLQFWQRGRLGRTYEDLAAQAGYRPAIHFFLSELYGGLDFRARDQDLGRVMPVMMRFLPDQTLATMSEAFELQAISLEFDIHMAAHLARRRPEMLDMAGSCRAYRACDDRTGRERQILLIRKLGYDLDALVRKPLVNRLVRLLRGPAHAAGFGRLQEFLEEGLESFRALPDAGRFVETIYEREWNAMQRMFEGAKKPFGF